MQELLLHIFLVFPAIRWLVSPARPYKKSTGILLGVIALTFVACVQLRRESNLYDALNVPNTATRSQIEGSYRRLSRLYHPDKQLDVKDKAAATEKFNAIRDAQEILRNAAKRKTYGRFGDYTSPVDADRFVDVFLLAIIQALVSFFMGFLYTTSKEAQFARQIYTWYLGMAFCIELLLRFGDGRTEEFLGWLPIFGKYLVFEKIRVFHKLAPTILNGSMILGSSAHADRTAFLEHFGKTLLTANIKLVTALENYAHQSGVAPVDIPTGVKQRRDSKDAEMEDKRSVAEQSASANVLGASTLSELYSWHSNRCRELAAFVHVRDNKSTKGFQLPVTLIIFAAMTIWRIVDWSESPAASTSK